ncbi:TPA: hypothetical protein NHK69_005135 [Pseudomonas aeruginosa]|nr:hypothetical protein [Pseudomonas aeruginosa]
MLMGLSNEDWLYMLLVIGVPVLVFGWLVFLLRRRIALEAAWIGVLFVAMAGVYAAVIILKRVQ